MSNITSKKISLDFYTNNLVTVVAKQYDTKSRFINVTFTDHGKKNALSPDDSSVLVGQKKPDGFAVLNDATIEDDGTATFELTPQMLARTGRSHIDLLVISGANITTENISDVTDIYDLEGSILSTMTFELNVLPSAIDHAQIESSFEYNYLLKYILKAEAVESHMKTLENTISSNEKTRVESEGLRSTAETARAQAEEDRVEAEKDRAEAEKARQNAEDDRAEAEKARVAAEKDRESAESNRATSFQEAIGDCSEATAAANTAAGLCQSVIDQSGIVMRSEKGVAGGVATLDDNAKVPAEQLNIVNNITTTIDGTVLDGKVGKTLADLITSEINALKDIINALPVCHPGVDEPDDSVGKDGDIYMQIIEEGE